MKAEGFVSSANQEPVDSAYPYYLGAFPIYRGLTINRQLSRLNSITTADMMKLQVDNFDVFAQMARPILLRNIDESHLNEEEKTYFNIFRIWNLNNDPAEEGPTIFYIWWNHLEHDIFDDEFSKTSLHPQRPSESTLVEALLRDTAYRFIDNVNTPNRETLQDVVTTAFRQTEVTELAQAGQDGRLNTWA